MARPAKSVAALSEYSQTKGELAARKEAEKKLSREGIPQAPAYLTEEQREIFDRIIYLLYDTGMIALNDEWIIAKTAVAIDRLRYLEEAVNRDKKLLTDKGVLSAQRAYTSDFYRGCNELCLSPQSRAKLANTAATEKTEAPLKKLFAEAGRAL